MHSDQHSEVSCIKLTSFLAQTFFFKKHHPRWPTTRIQLASSAKHIFGWTVSVQTSEKLERTQTAVEVLQTNIDLRSFRETEEVPMYKQLSPEEQMCEQHFTQTTTINRGGGFVLKIPFKAETGKLGNSYDKAE